MSASRAPPNSRIQTQQVEIPLPGQLEAGGQIRVGAAPAFQPVPAQPDHHPLVGGGGIDGHPMDGAPSHQQQVPGAEKVGDALHHIGHLSAQAQDELVEFVVMILQLLGAAVLQMEQPEVLA